MLEDYYKFIKIDEGYKDTSGLADVLEIFIPGLCNELTDFKEHVNYFYLNVTKVHLFVFKELESYISIKIDPDINLLDIFEVYDPKNLDGTSRSNYISTDKIDNIYDFIKNWFIKSKALLVSKENQEI